MGRKNTYEEGYVFPSGIILVKRIGKDKYRTAICDFKCPKCGKIFRYNIGNIARGRKTSCGCLSSSYYANLIEQILLSNQIKYIKEKIFNDCINPKANYKLRFDFYLPDYNTCIEYDGKQHFKPVEQWDKNDSLEDRQYRDNIKTRYCFEHNIKLIRIPYTESLNINDKYILSKL